MSHGYEATLEKRREARVMMKPQGWRAAGMYIMYILQHISLCFSSMPLGNEYPPSSSHPVGTCMCQQTHSSSRSNLLLLPPLTINTRAGARIRLVASWGSIPQGVLVVRRHFTASCQSIEYASCWANGKLFNMHFFYVHFKNCNT